MLPATDEEYLRERGLAFEVVIDGGMTCVVISGWQLPPGYTARESDLLLRLSPGYPDVPPDMWWFCPALVRVDGAAIPATESQEPYLGRTWQRWSRHFNGGQWLPSNDTLEGYLALVKGELHRNAGPAEAAS